MINIGAGVLFMVLGVWMTFFSGGKWVFYFNP